ncbi:hypothetical protein [Kitasatospora griseola]|uniref:hypothetical protein n=1 Tax=Kitasatospora griseola TaxID=2064 RepID=UPI00166F95F7|nr:hypothetical protein [Kitasatospora griseola]
MPVSRNRKQSKAAASRKIRRSPNSNGTPMLVDTTDLVVNLLTTAPPEQLVELVMPHLLTNISTGQPANRCVDASLTLHHAFAQFAIPSELMAVSLLTESAGGTRRSHGSTTPSWSADGTTFHGHSVLFLPQSGRFVDATADQFAEVRRHGLGPVIGRVTASTTKLAPGQGLPAGAAVLVQRGDVLLRYTVADAEPLLADQPWMTRHAAQHRQAGIKPRHPHPRRPTRPLDDRAGPAGALPAPSGAAHHNRRHPLRAGRPQQPDVPLPRQPPVPRRDPLAPGHPGRPRVAARRCRGPEPSAPQ